MSKVFLVTGSSRGLGRSIAEAVLAAGHQLVGTARNPAQLDDIVQQYGDRVRAVALDVTDSAAARDAVQVALDAFGRLDVVVNNAGYANIASVEDITAEDFRAQVDTAVRLCNSYSGALIRTCAIVWWRRTERGL